ncbi:MAG: hypothetical protein WB646_00910 [Steroidobacteraceae bacterium]
MRSSSYVSKDDLILASARGHSVLHIGCVGFTDLPAAERVRLAQRSLHWKLSQVAATIGVDYSKSVIDEYRRLGIFDNVICGDVQQLDDVPLKTTFEIVVVADIIEHLSCPGAMLDGLRRFCTSASRVIITTPHAFGLLNYLRFLSGRFKEGNEHVMTFNIANICNLLTRHGYEIDCIDTCYQSAAKSKGWVFHLGKILFRAFPRLGGTLFVVAHLAVNEHAPRM